MNADPSKVILIEGLDPESADKMGYVWWKDIIFDKEAPKEAMTNIPYFLAKGYVFGKCVTEDGETNNLIGVYQKKASG